MHFFVAGLAAIAMVVVIVGAFVLSPTGPAEDRLPSRAERTLRTPGTPEKKSKTAQSPRFKEETRPWAERPDGILSSREKKRIDRRGYLKYTVTSDDTLKSLARRYLGRERLWEEILRHNPQLDGPKSLRLGRTIKIPLWLREDW